MPRGRSIDHSLAPTRSLINQRDYRARRAAKLKELEDAVVRLTAENTSLRAEVAELRACVPSNYSLSAAQQGVIDTARAQLLTALRGLDSLDPAAAAAGSLPTAPIAPPPQSPAAQAHFAAPPSVHGSDVVGADGGPASPALSAMTDMSGTSGLSAVSYASFMSQQQQHAQSPHAMVPVPVQHQQQRPAPQQPQLDPNCCGGLFDCSDLPGVQMSDVRSSWRQPPGQQAQQHQQQQQPSPQHQHQHAVAAVPLVSSPARAAAGWYGGAPPPPPPANALPFAHANGAPAAPPPPQHQQHQHQHADRPVAGPDELVPGGTGKCCMGVIDCGLLGVSDTE